MHLVRKNRLEFFLFSFFITIVDQYGNFQYMFGRTFVGALHRGAIGETAAYSETYVFIAHDTVIGGVESEPAVERNIGFYPGMGGAFAAEFVVLGTDITTYITGGDTTEP